MNYLLSIDLRYQALNKNNRYHTFDPKKYIKFYSTKHNVFVTELPTKIVNDYLIYKQAGNSHYQSIMMSSVYNQTSYLKAKQAIEEWLCK